MTKRVLVTGATGFVGRPSLPALAARGFDVHAVHATGTPDASATWHPADLHDRERVARLLDEVRPTHLLHFAWYMKHGDVYQSPENLRWVESSLALLREFAERGGRRVVVAGTCAEYDWSHGYCSERSTPTDASTLYGISKNALRQLAAAFTSRSGIGLAWGRIFSPYGPRENPRRFIPSVIRSLLDREPVRCSHGNQYRDFLHADDCGDAFAALLDGDVEGPVNVSSGEPVTLKEVIRAIVGLIPGAEDVPIHFGAVPSPLDEPPLLIGDNRRLANEVGWTPGIGLRDGLARTIDHWRARSEDPGEGRPG